MRIAFFVHSIASDWNHGNAHFLRGLMSALADRGHRITSWERVGAWSAMHLVEDGGTAPIVRFAREFPEIRVRCYGGGPGLRERVAGAVGEADLVIVHEWNDPDVVGLVGLEARRQGGIPVLFHDTHHRPVSAPHAIAALPLERYDGVLAFGESLRCVYRQAFGIERTWTFHEAADVRRFRPLERSRDTDVLWIGNWGDEERSDALRRFWLGAAGRLPELRFDAWGARYPDSALREVEEAGVRFNGWAPSLDVPELFARTRATLHIPRRLYVERLPGIPTIRVFEALACGVPLVSTPWRDSEGLFRPGDYTVVETPDEMVEALRRIVRDPAAAAEQAERGLATIRDRHTCDHRAEQLMEIVDGLGRAGA